MEATTKSQTTSTKEKILIYDDDCPLCQAYSGAFVKMGLLKSENRIAFNSINDETFGGRMDALKSKNEIPLIDAQGGATLYGTDALIAILSNRWPIFEVFQRNKILRFISKKAYSFISYNRKIIVPSTYQKDGINCAPSINISWRFTFIILALAIGNFLLYSVSSAYTLSIDFFMIPFVLFAMQCVGALLSSRSKLLDYVGNISMVCLIQGLLIAAAFNISRFIPDGLFYLLPCVFAIVWFEHFRRAKILGYGAAIQIIWSVNQSAMWLWIMKEII